MARRARVKPKEDEGPGTNAGVGWDDSRGYWPRPIEPRDGWSRYRPKPEPICDDDTERDLLDEIG